MNPFNPEAGETPAPTAPADIELAERSARVIWRAFPYFGWRYGARGSSFGRSDAGFLLTLQDMEEAAAHAQVAWLARLLAARGMPSLLLEYQLESLARLSGRRGRAGEAGLRALAGRLRSARLGVLDASVGPACEALCRRASNGASRRRGAGLLIAAAVADRAVGFGAHEDALVAWLCAAAPGEQPWSEACSAALALARARCADTGDHA